MSVLRWLVLIFPVALVVVDEEEVGEGGAWGEEAMAH